MRYRLRFYFSRRCTPGNRRFPMGGNFRGYLELFHGCGESMSDYRHKATYLGLGVSLLAWY